MSLKFGPLLMLTQQNSLTLKRFDLDTQDWWETQIY